MLIKREDFAERREFEEKSSLQLAMEAENEARIEEATQEGRREGFAKGLTEARAKFSDAMSSLASVDEATEKALEDTVLKLVAECLQSIAGSEVQSETTRTIVRNVIKTSLSARPSVLLVSREDAGLLHELLVEASNIKVEVDDSLSAGDILIVTPRGRRRLGMRDQITAILRQLSFKTE